MAQPRALTDMPLDRNESYWLLDDVLLESCKNFDVRALSTYPDYESLKVQLAQYAGVSIDQICITPGSDAAIEVITRELVGTNGEVLLPVPTFYGYESILDRAGAIITPVTYTETHTEFQFPEQELLSLLDSKEIKALFLCSPNNPLGNSIPESSMRAIAEKMQSSHAFLISDEAYFEYSNSTLLPLLNQMPNLIIVRTLSKGFGIPGARVGYCIAAPQIIKQLEKQLLPWPIAHISFFVAQTLLAQEPRVRARREFVIKSRDEFVVALGKFDSIHVYPSQTNFVLVRVPNAEHLVTQLALAGIRVALGKVMSRFPEARRLLDSTIRVAVPSSEDRIKFLHILTETLQTS